MHSFARKRGSPPLWCDNRGMSRLSTMITALDDGQPLPDPRRGSSLYELPTGKTERYYLERFMEQFGADWNETAIVQDKTGLHDLAVSRVMFEEHNTGASKITKRGRAPWLLYIAETVRNSDEIRLHQGDYGDRSLYLLARFSVVRGVLNVVAVFKEDGRVWTGCTGYQDFRPEYMQSKRGGVLIYRRPET
jgi:hypothetical protein